MTLKTSVKDLRVYESLDVFIFVKDSFDVEGVLAMMASEPVVDCIILLLFLPNNCISAIVVSQALK